MDTCDLCAKLMFAFICTYGHLQTNADTSFTVNLADKQHLFEYPGGVLCLTLLLNGVDLNLSSKTYTYSFEFKLSIMQLEIINIDLTITCNSFPMKRQTCRERKAFTFWQMDMYSVIVYDL